MVCWVQSTRSAAAVPLATCAELVPLDARAVDPACCTVRSSSEPCELSQIHWRARCSTGPPSTASTSSAVCASDRGRSLRHSSGSTGFCRLTRRPGPSAGGGAAGPRRTAASAGAQLAGRSRGDLGVEARGIITVDGVQAGADPATSSLDERQLPQCRRALGQALANEALEPAERRQIEVIHAAHLFHSGRVRHAYELIVRLRPPIPLRDEADELAMIMSSMAAARRAGTSTGPSGGSVGR
jgi:hypothetical protein